MRSTVVVLSFLLLLFTVIGAAQAARPEIAYIHPGYYSAGPHIITGENFLDEGLELWALYLPTRGEEVDAAIRTSGLKLREGSPDLPAVPPKEARKVPIMDVEERVLVADLFTGNTGSPQVAAVWVKNKDGFSAPYALNAAMPFWISDEQVQQGAVIHLFGFGLRLPFQKTLLLLQGPGGDYFIPDSVDPGGMRDRDSRLVYFRLPAGIKPGEYEAYVHNSFGLQYGWKAAGKVFVRERRQGAERIYDARSFGARGDGKSNDYAALTKAMAAAGRTGGVVLLAPGTYMTDQTLQVPSGVTLRGSDRGNTVVKGFGYNPALGRRAWYASDNIPASVIALTDRTALECLSVKGHLSKGIGGQGMVMAFPAEVVFPDGGVVSDITIRDCFLQSERFDPQYGTMLYTSAFRSDVPSSRLLLTGNETFGSFSLAETRRAEIIGNTFRQGSVGGSGSASLVQGNFFKDAPGRLLFYPRRHSYIRLNEMSNYGSDSWNNAPEAYLVHGGGKKTVGSPSSVTPVTLTDVRRRWEADEYAGNVVLITAGRGFGQYRMVRSNTADTLALEEPWRVLPDADSEYAVGRFYTESAFYGNLNTGPARLSLWLDCLGLVVERHRDTFAGGMDVWGADGTKVDKDGNLQNMGSYTPSFYNMFLSNWLDGSDISLLGGHNPANAYRGPVLFGNYVVRNTIRQPHMRRLPQDSVHEGRMGPPRAGVMVGLMSAHQPPEGRMAVSHSIVRDNFISQTPAGILVFEHARKSFLLGNEFQQVADPVQDRGAGTQQRGQRLYLSDDRSDRQEALSDKVNSRSTVVPPRPTFKEPDYIKPWWAKEAGPFSRQAELMRPFISYRGFVDADLESGEKLKQCQDNLKRLYAIVQAHEKKRGSLPKAAFYPARPLTDPDSIQVLLGKEALTYLQCPSAGPDFAALGWPNYIWNSLLNGKRLADIEKPAETWLMMDFVGVHDWMVAEGHCGHRRGVNILYADGSVRWVSPFDWVY